MPELEAVWRRRVDSTSNLHETFHSLTTGDSAAARKVHLPCRARGPVDFESRNAEKKPGFPRNAYSPMVAGSPPF